MRTSAGSARHRERGGEARGGGEGRGGDGGGGEEEGRGGGEGRGGDGRGGDGRGGGGCRESSRGLTGVCCKGGYLLIHHWRKGGANGKQQWTGERVGRGGAGAYAFSRLRFQVSTAALPSPRFLQLCFKLPHNCEGGWIGLADFARLFQHLLPLLSNTRASHFPTHVQAAGWTLQIMSACCSPCSRFSPTPVLHTLPHLCRRLDGPCRL